MNGPLFPVGFEVLVARYVGLVSPDSARLPGNIVCHIEGIRLDAEVGEEWDDETEDSRRIVSYEKGWRYLIVTSTGKVWGWEYESDLLAAGYAPPQTVAA